jgi:hypothetical protein
MSVSTFRRETMLKLYFITSGIITISLELGISSGQVLKVPTTNVKSFSVSEKEIILAAKDMSNYSDWGVIELLPSPKGTEKVITVCVDSDVWGWFGTGQIMLEKDNKLILSDNFSSGVKGPIGDPRKYKTYPITDLLR